MAQERESTQFDSTKSWLDAGSKAFLILYGIGYFIESYYDSRYGLGYINPLRSKVGFTGIAFGLQVLTAVVLFKVEEIVNNSSLWGAASKSVVGFYSRLLKIPYFITWIVECCLIALVLTFIFATDVQGNLSQVGHRLGQMLSHLEQMLRPHIVAIPGPTASSQAEPPDQAGPLDMKAALYMAISFLVMATGGTLARFKRIPIFIAGLLTTAGGIVFIITVSKSDAHASSTRSVFLAFIAFVALIRLAFTMIPRNPRTLSIKRKAGLLLLALAAPILYAHAIYGKVSQQWGGGHGAPVIIKFERDMPPFGLTSPVYMLEETDEGFYLVDAKDDHQAIYVPRKDVKEVGYFGTSPIPSAFLTPKPSSESAQAPQK